MLITLFNRLKHFSELRALSRLRAPGTVLSRAGVRRLIVCCEVLLVIILAQQLARLTWQWVDNPETSASQPWPLQSATVHRQPSEKGAYPALDNLHLFGQEPIKLAQAENRGIDPNAVPKSRLSAKVTGIVASTIAADSVAVIQSGGRDRTYRMGEKLLGSNAEVKDIYEDRVIVFNRGQHEALLLYPDEAARTVEKRNPGRLAEVYQQLLTDPASLADFVQFTTVQKQGQLVGYQLHPGKFPEVFRQSGLKPDDIALSINGYDLSDSNDTLKLLQEIHQLAQLSMTIERDGRLYEIEIKL